MAVQAQRFCFSRLPSHLCQYKMSAFYFSLCFSSMQTEWWLGGKKCYQSVSVIPKGRKQVATQAASICSESMICGSLARTLAHMPITQEHHLLFCLLGGSLLAPRYFTVTQLAQAQGLKCALHSAVGNQCSLWILYLRTEEPSSQLFTSCDRCFSLTLWLRCICSPQTLSLLQTFMEYIRLIHMISIFLEMFLA